NPIYPGGPGALAKPRAVAIGTGGECHGPLHEGADVRLQRVDILGEHGLLDSRDQALVSQVDPLDLDPGRLLLEQIVKLRLGEFTDRLVRVEEAATAEDAPVPAVHAITGDGKRALFQRLALVVELRQVEVGDRAHALAVRAHSTLVDCAAHYDALALAFVHCH